MSIMLVIFTILAVSLEGMAHATNSTGSHSGTSNVITFVRIVKVTDHKSISTSSLFSDPFLPNQSGACNNEENVYGTYATFEEAQIACFNDSQCVAVQDEDCNHIGDFHLCKKGIRSSRSSCIYEKKDFKLNGKS